jgi:hypothetical protein
MLDVAQDGFGAIDSLPLPVMQFHLAPQRTKDWDAAGATFGYCASKHETFFGYRLHLVVTLAGLIVDFELTPATADEREAAADMLSNHPERTYLRDKGYVSAPLAERLEENAGVRLLALRRVKQRASLPETLTRSSMRFRQIIETVNSQLADQFTIEHNYARSFWGLCARLYTKLAAHTLCIFSTACSATPTGCRSTRSPFLSSTRAQYYHSSARPLDEPHLVLPAFPLRYVLRLL